MESKLERKPILGGRLSDESFITLFMLGVLVLVFSLASLVVPNFFTAQNVINLITNNWFVIILGIGVTFLLITGNFDMSVGGVIALTGVLSVYFCQGVNVSKNVLANGLGLPYVVAVVLALLCAMGVGGLNAFFVTRLKVPSIIVTLGTMMLARGAAQVITQGAQRNTSLPAVFGLLGSIGIPGTTVRLSLMVMIALILISFFFEKKMIFARRIYLIGANPVAARLSGINVGKYVTSLYILSALARRYYRDTPGFRVQGWCFEPRNGLRVRRTGHRSPGRRQHRRRVRLCARYVCRRPHSISRYVGSHRAPALTGLAVHP